MSHQFAQPIAAMIFATDLYPVMLSMSWEMDKYKCASALGAVPSGGAERYVHATTYIKNKSRNISLLFDDHNQLERIELILFQSQSFWDSSYDDLSRVAIQYGQLYRQTIAFHIALLGTPTFSDACGAHDFPADLSASHVTYWIWRDSRVQIELDHPDREYPIFIRLSCTRIPTAIQ